MSAVDIKIARPRATRPCKICGSPSPLFGTVDFNKSCEEARGFFLPKAGIDVGYNRCGRCRFLFTSAFDQWSHEDFARAVYNDAYIKVDPDYKEFRPANNARMITQLLDASKGSLSMLDYGGGNGVLSNALRENGFARADTYDPFVTEFAALPKDRYSVVTSFETLEHVPEPKREIAQMARCIADDGIAIFSTLVQPADFDQIGLGWWYLSPRNGHISLFSREALADAWGQQGYKVGSFNDNLHVAYRTVPAFAQAFLKG